MECDQIIMESAQDIVKEWEKEIWHRKISNYNWNMKTV